MKITQLVATNKKTKYHESVASRLPKGIKTQQRLLNLGYKIAVEDLGLAKAKTLNENFAVNLVNSYHNRMLNEGVGSFLGKAAGNVVGAVGAAGRGISNAWKDAKQGYADAKASWDPATGAPAPAAPATSIAPAAPTTSGTPAAAGGADRPYVAPASGAAASEEPPAASPGGATPTPPAAGTPPKTGGGVGDIMKAIDGLDPASKKQLAGELDKSINTPPPAAPGATPADAAAPAAPGATPADAAAPAAPPADAAAPAAPPAPPADAAPAAPAAPPTAAPPAKSPVTGSTGGGRSMMDLKGAGVTSQSQLANVAKNKAAGIDAQKAAALAPPVQKQTFAADKRSPALQAKMKQAGFREDVDFHSNFLGIKI